MIDLRWGGFTNGSLPDSALSPIDGNGHKLEHVAAARFLAMQAACLAATGHTFTVAPGADSATRTLAQQQADWDAYQAHTGNTAAYPGTSNHGWGRAVDITGYETATSHWVGSSYVNDSPVWQWLLAHMSAYGYSWDTGNASHESWHLESYNTPSATALADVTVTPITEEEPMRYPFIFITRDGTGLWYKYDGRAKWAVNQVDAQLLRDCGFASPTDPVKVLGSKLDTIPDGK